MDEKWWLNNLTVVVPVTASAFAFAYVVGYFYAFDIAWFPSFSLSDHLVFALRALPVAIGASVGLLTALRCSPDHRLCRWFRDKSSWFTRLTFDRCIAIEEGVDAGSHLGHVIFAGNLWVLFYDYVSKSVVLIKQDRITMLQEGDCPGFLR
jgi:hypothetical protein